MGFGLHVTGNVNKTPVVDSEIAAQTERRLNRSLFGCDELRDDTL